MVVAEAVAVRARWAQSPWREVAPKVLEALHSGTRLKKLHLPVHEGRTDLRGIPFPTPLPRGSVGLPAAGASPAFEFTLIRGRFEIAGMSLKDVDLSFADISAAVWRDCSFRNTLLRGVNMGGGFFRNCAFEDAAFDGAYLRDSLVGGCEGKAITSFRRTSFRHADLRNTYYHHPVFEDCDFSSALLDGVDFRGSRFIRCKFAGDMTRVWFRGLFAMDATRRGARERDRLRQAQVRPEEVWNPMTDVDFSTARLYDCMFVSRIDLSRCRFPNDAAHIVIRDRQKVWSAMRTELSASWEEPARSEALKFLEILADRKDQEGQKMDLVNRETFEKTHYDKPEQAKPWEHDFFDLLRSVAGRTGT